MVTIVIGASCSGKSEYAERCLDDEQGEKIYLATMNAVDEESRDRIRRHRERRSGRAFQTMELPVLRESDVEMIPEGFSILLEGIGTLAANELFGGERPAEMSKAKERILFGISTLAGRARNLVIVSDEVNRAGSDYEGETRLYMQLVGELNQELCRRADRVVEMVCSIPVERLRRMRSGA